MNFAEPVENKLNVELTAVISEICTVNRTIAMLQNKTPTDEL